jgi:hypothetical protein
MENIFLTSIEINEVAQVVIKGVNFLNRSHPQRKKHSNVYGVFF